MVAVSYSVGVSAKVLSLNVIAVVSRVVLDLAKKSKIAFINNPTYKVFNEKHILYEKRFRDINKQMYYLPCIYNMDDSDMNELYFILKNVLDN